MSTALSVFAIVAGLAVGSFTGNKIGRKNCEKEINAKIGSVQQETERIRNEAKEIEQKAKAILAKAEADAKHMIEKAKAEMAQQKELEELREITNILVEIDES